MTIREMLARAANLEETVPSDRQMAQALADIYREVAKTRRHVRTEHIHEHPSMTAQAMQDRLLAVEDEEIA